MSRIFTALLPLLLFAGFLAAEALATVFHYTQPENVAGILENDLQPNSEFEGQTP